MKEEMKFYLLAEESGWNLSPQAFKYGQELKSSDQYEKLKENVERAKDHLSHKARGLVDSFSHLNFYTSTIKDCFILESSFDHLYLHSFPEYYLNPLAVSPNYKGEITTIGELIFEFDGQDRALNDIILDEKESLEYKMERIEPRLEYYLSDMTRIAEESIKELEKNTISKNTVKGLLVPLLEIVFFILVHVFLFFTWINPFPIFFDHVYDPTPYHALTYLVYLYPLLVLIYDLSFIAFHIYRANINESYNYAKRFLKRSPEALLERITKRKEDLENYIRGAIYASIPLTNDISDFSCLSESYVDLKAIQDVQKYKNKKSYRFLRSSLYATTTITMIASLIFFIIYLVAFIFQVSI